MATVSEERQPDTNAELANEGMYLAWLRTGLALAALGVAAERLLPAEGIIWARQLVGVSLILAGVLTAGSARWRWQTIDRAMRAERRIPQPILGYVVAAIVVLDGLATIVLLLRADAGWASHRTATKGAQDAKRQRKARRAEPGLADAHRAPRLARLPGPATRPATHRGRSRAR